MAHTILATRGILGDTITFINELSTRYVPFRWFNKKTGKMEDRHIQLRVSPVLLWDISYPKECRDIIHATIFRDGKGGKPINKFIEKFVNMVRMGMKLKKIPEYKTDKVLSMRLPENIEIVGIGVKEDKWITEDGRQVSEDQKTDLSYEGI